MALFKLPRIVARTAIVDSGGKAIIYFTRFWDEFAKAIEQQVNSILAVQAEIQAIQTTQAAEIARLNAVVFANQQAQSAAQAAQQAANNAQTTADDALGGGTVSGFSLDPTVTVTSATWVQGPQVDLTGVVAGTLTITGSGPQQDTSVQLLSGPYPRSFGGEFRIVEIVGMTETVVFTGNFSAFQGEFDASASVSNDSSLTVTAFSDPASSTGSVSYRMDASRASGSSTIDELDLYLYVRRAP